LRATRAHNFANGKPGAVHGKGAPDVKCSWNLFFASGQATIAQGNACKTFWHFGHHAKANEGAPVLAKQGNVFDINRFKPSTHPLHMIFVGVVGALRGLVCAAKTHLIGHQHAHARIDQDRNHFAIKK
jgi:hypothetical protein